MEGMIETAAEPGARPYGILGLLLSLLGVLVIASGVLAGFAGLFALINGLLFGWADVGDSFSALTAGSLDQVATAGLLVGSAAYVAAAFAIYAMARRRAGDGWRSLLGWTSFRTDRIFWALLAGAVAYQMVAGALVRFIHPEAKNWLILPDGPLGVASAVLLIAVLAPICEELLFRGWIFTALRWRYGFASALWVTAVLFALAHWEKTYLYALAILPMGLLLGYLRERTGSTRATILFHTLYNSAGLAVSFLGKL